MPSKGRVPRDVEESHRVVISLENVLTARAAHMVRAQSRLTSGRMRHLACTMITVCCQRRSVSIFCPLSKLLANYDAIACIEGYCRIDVATPSHRDGHTVRRLDPPLSKIICLQAVTMSIARICASLGQDTRGARPPKRMHEGLTRLFRNTCHLPSKHGCSGHCDIQFTFSHSRVPTVLSVSTQRVHRTGSRLYPRLSCQIQLHVSVCVEAAA
jgi:hypothetical protein